MKIYLCGAINGCSDSQCKDWREHVKTELAFKCEFLDPMRRDYRGIEHNASAEIVANDEQDIKDSDVILVMANKPSWGTAMEMRAAAKEYKKLVVTVCDNERVSPWLVQHSTIMVKTLDEAINVIKEMKRERYDD